MKNIIKSIIGTMAACIILASPANADTLKVEALTPFSSIKPVKAMQVKLTENVLYDGVNLLEGYVISGKIVDVKRPTRLKRNAKFSFIPEYYTDENGVEHKFKDRYEGKYALPIDKGKMAKSAVLTVGSHFVKGISLGVNAVQGAVQNEEGNRLKSAGKNVYENSLLSYVESGKELEIQKGDRFYLKFGLDADEEQGYDY
jgi:hypothetical protein